jgi:SP family arabinose:H+ symporter-like MFS transporter
MGFRKGSRVSFRLIDSIPAPVVERLAALIGGNAPYEVQLDSAKLEEDMNPALYAGLQRSPLLSLCVAISSLCFLCYGFDTGIIGHVQTLPSYKHAMGLTNSSRAHEATVNSWVTSSLSLAGGFASIFVGSMNDCAGRKSTMLIGTVVNVLGSLLQTLAPSLMTMICGRVFMGLALGILISSAPTYIAELSFTTTRGFCGALSSLSTTFGLFCAAFVAFCFTRRHGNENTFRYVLAFQAGIALLVFLLLLPLPESPRWLLTRGRDKEAYQNLKRLRGGAQVVGQAAEVTVTSVEAELLLAMVPIEQGVSIFTSSMTLRLTIAFCLPVWQQLSGQTLVLWYGPHIYETMNLPAQSASMITTATLFLSTFVCLFVIDRMGRRALMIWGTIGCLSCMAGLASVFVATDPAKDAHIATGVLALILGYEFCYANSWAAMPFLYPSEMFPTAFRARGHGFSMLVKWFASFGIAKAGPHMMLSVSEGGLSPAGTYFFFAMAGVLTLIHVLTNIPETASLPLESVDQVFHVSSWQQYRNFVRHNLCGRSHLRVEVN